MNKFRNWVLTSLFKVATAKPEYLPYQTIKKVHGSEILNRRTRPDND